MAKRTCEAAADPKVFGGPRCGKPATFETRLGDRCDACAELFRVMARDPAVLINILAGGPKTEEQIERMLRPIQPLEAPRCDGDHFFENICNTCNAAQPSGSCAVCPHMPGSHPSEHYIRRPCKECGGHDLRSVRVREAL